MGVLPTRNRTATFKHLRDDYRRRQQRFGIAARAPLRQQLLQQTEIEMSGIASTTVHDTYEESVPLTTVQPQQWMYHLDTLACATERLKEQCKFETYHLLPF